MRTRDLASHDLDSLLGSANNKVIANNTSLRREANGDLVVTLHSTDIFRESPNGDVTFNTGGWNTATTRKRLNAFGAPRFNVGTRKGQLHVRDRRTDVEHPFDTSITINRWSGEVISVN